MTRTPDWKYDILVKAQDLAITRFGKELDDLPSEAQHSIQREAELSYADEMAERVELIREDIKS